MVAALEMLVTDRVHALLEYSIVVLAEQFSCDLTSNNCIIVFDSNFLKIYARSDFSFRLLTIAIANRLLSTINLLTTSLESEDARLKPQTAGRGAAKAKKPHRFS